MNACYDDIMSKIPEEPTWFDENAVPRYCSFHPSCVADIYAHNCALVKIACQNCEHQFLVSMSWSFPWHIKRDGPPDRLLAGIGYGDPPNVCCCAAGPTMTSDVLEVLEFWHKTDAFEWRRENQFEGLIPVSPEE